MRTSFQTVSIAFCAIACVVALPLGVTAQETSYVSPPWAANAANSTFQEWDAFTTTSGDTPDAGHFPTDLTAAFSAASPAFVTSDDHIYSYADYYNWSVDIGNYGGAGPGTAVIVQTSDTFGGSGLTPGNYDNFGVVVDSVCVVQPNGDPIPGGDNGSAAARTYSSRRVNFTFQVKGRPPTKYGCGNFICPATPGISR